MVSSKIRSILQKQNIWLTVIGIGFGLYAANVDSPDGKVTSALTTSSEGKACYNRPDTWPIVLLAE